MSHCYPSGGRQPGDIARKAGRRGFPSPTIVFGTSYRRIPRGWLDSLAPGRNAGSRERPPTTFPG